MEKGTAMLARHAAHFGLALGELHAQGAHTDALRMSHVHYVQRHHGVPVLGSEIIVHANPNGALSTINGRTLPIPEGSVDATPAILGDTAIVAARAIADGDAEPIPTCCGSDASGHALKSQGVLEAITAPKLYTYNAGFLTNTADTPSHLVWMVVLGVPGGKVSEAFYIDARDSSLIARESSIQHLNREVYNCGDDGGDTICYVNAFSSFYNHYFGRSEGRPVNGPNPVPGFTFGSTDVDTLYDYVPLIEAYYLSEFARNGANDHGGLGKGTTSNPYGMTRIFTNINGGAFGSYCNPSND